MSKYFRKNSKKRKNKNKNNKSKVSQCSVPSFRIDLQIAPAQRWIHIVKTYHKEIKRLVNAILSLEQYQISSDDQQTNNTETTHNNPTGNSNTFFTNLTLGIFDRLNNLGGTTYIQEMKGIANTLKKDGITIEHILLTHLLYESFCGCTSIIAQNTKNNQNSLVLGRTLDWIDFDGQLLRHLTIDIEVYNGNKYLYKYTTFAGYIGALTALKFGQFSFAINFREFSTMECEDNIHESDSWPIGLLGRHVCEHCSDYKSAVQIWNESPLMAPTYVSIAGVSESVLITRDERQSIKPLMFGIEQKLDGNDMKENVSGGIEYILQTNIDHWSYTNETGNDKKKKKKRGRDKLNVKSESNSDTMDSIRRLNTGHKCLIGRKGNLDENEMWNLLYEYPIHDRNWTIYSTVMNVKSGYYKTMRHIYK